MSNETLDPRALLAKMEAEEQAAREKVTKLAEQNEKLKKELLSKLRGEDLADVKAKCELHGFTATELRGALKTKGGARKSAPRKTVARKTTTTRRKKQAA